RPLVEKDIISKYDNQEIKTMNTHLHVLEAFSNLYRIWPDEVLKGRISDLLNDFSTHIIDGESGHLKLFFDEDWNSKSSIISYGHDIEAAWLLLEAAEIIEAAEWVDKFKSVAVKMAYATIEGIDKDGGLWYERDPSANHTNKEKHWWVQAEAMVGFYNAWQISADPIFLDKFNKVWEYTQKNIIDHEHGEWFWGIGQDGEVMAGEDKVGLWKCPYHNSRACLEILKRR
ncbi:MAG: N-acyl-D-glucosamine 2-epimerase, partial [Pedobacter sp.]